MPDFLIRDALPQDSADIARLVHALAAYEKLAHEAVATADDFRQQLFGSSPTARAAVAEIAGVIVGIAVWFHNFSTFTCRPGLYVEDVFVEPQHRGLGIGRGFFRYMAKHAVKSGCSRMDWSVLDWNEPAIRFYRSMGAVGMDDWTVQRLDARKLAALAQED